jgi:hypothetical protein
MVAEDGGGVTFDGHPVGARVRFEGDRMFVANPQYGEDRWERVEVWTPANASEFAGIYRSEDAETVLRVEVKDGGLVIRRRPDRTFVLKPTYADAFSSSLGSIHFVRDGKGRVAGFDLGSGRVWRLRFGREASDGAAGKGAGGVKR